MPHFNLLVESTNNRLIDGITSLQTSGISFINIDVPISSITSNPFENTLLNFLALLRPNIGNIKVKDYSTERYIKSKGPPVFSEVRIISLKKIQRNQEIILF